MSANKALIREWFQIAWVSNKLEELDRIISDDHPVGANEVKRSFKKLHELYRDLKANIEDQIAEGDRVVTRLSVSGTYQGRKTKWMAIYIHKIEAGKIANVWRLRDSPDVSKPQELRRTAVY